MNTCSWCGTKFVGHRTSRGKFCGFDCMGKSNSDKVLQSWLSGEDPGWTGKTVQLKTTVRRYILAQAGNACSICGWSEKHPIDGLPLVEVDHINGDPFDCSPENLRVLCPNHHAMTETHRARNRGSGRKR
jgi:hypothetical protein